jgi:antitoxin (DNA-binding transcriptional repressor) of toxin-antitoxin stability system
MSAVSVREFFRNPSAVFVRVERGEAIEVTGTGRLSRWSCRALASSPGTPP